MTKAWSISTFLVSDVEDEKLKEELQAAIDEVIPTPVKPKALDPNIGEAGGAAFLWEDVLKFGDGMDAVQSLIKDGLNPKQAVDLIVRLIKSWHQLRSVRVELDRDGFMVLRAVHRGRTSVQAIASFRTNVRSTLPQLLRAINPGRSACFSFDSVLAAHGSGV